MKYLNYKQLAFVLDITPVKALEKILVVHCKLKGLHIPYPEEKATDYLFDIVKGKKVRNSFPDTMAIDVLSEHLGLPTLQAMVDDIELNYLNRPASKKWILCDCPEKQIKSAESTEKIISLKIPAALRSMLPEKIQEEIKGVWKKRYASKTVSVN